MEFVDSNQPAIDRVENVKSVLKFLAETLTWARPQEGVCLSERGTNGLWIILGTCEETLDPITNATEDKS